MKRYYLFVILLIGFNAFGSEIITDFENSHDKKLQYETIGKAKVLSVDFLVLKEISFAKAHNLFDAECSTRMTSLNGKLFFTDIFDVHYIRSNDMKTIKSTIVSGVCKVL